MKRLSNDESTKDCFYMTSSDGITWIAQKKETKESNIGDNK